MTTARQLIRWAIPGYLLFIFLGTFALIRAVFVTGLAIFDFAALRALPGGLFFVKYAMPQLLVLVGATGIPLGFLIYQAYFVGYWRGFGFMRTGPQDKGWEIVKDIDVDWRALFGKDTKIPQHCLTKRTFIRSRETAECLFNNWHSAQSLSCLALDRTNSRYMRENTQYLTDIYHSVGATRMALMISFFGLYLPWLIGRSLPAISTGTLSFLLALYKITRGLPVTFPVTSLSKVLFSPYALSTAVNFALFFAIRRVLSHVRTQVLEDIVSLERKFLVLLFGVRDDKSTS